MKILHRDSLQRGGFAGLKEHRLVTDSSIFGAHKDSGAWDGLGNFVYLADASFMPHGQTNMHDHREIDVISVMMSGRIQHAGSLEDGQMMESHHAQVQRAGGEGFSHNEINPDDTENRMIQLWVKPQVANQKADYKLYEPKEGMTRIYGGSSEQDETFDNSTVMEVGVLQAGADIAHGGKFMAYITKGAGLLSGVSVKEGDLIRDNNLMFIATEDSELILIYENA
ncbi:MAG: pilus assembly protein [Sulfurimonas sp.]|nr:pilus assembly protein [Sulfurimonas sp.]